MVLPPRAHSPGFDPTPEGGVEEWWGKKKNACRSSLCSVPICLLFFVVVLGGLSYIVFN